MPNASKYIVDVSKMQPGGNPAKELWVGNSESKYAMLGNNVIYDKVLYELSVDNMSDVEPNAQTVTFNYTSKRTHGIGTVDTLYINPSTAQIEANTSTSSTKTTNFTINQALSLNGTTTGTGVTVSVTQKKDYPTGISLSISPKYTIPAAGGTITTALTNFNYSVKAAYKSGNSNVDVTNSCTITANVNEVSAGSKGTTESSETTAGNILFTASYTCNGVTKTSQVTVAIKQDANVKGTTKLWGEVILAGVSLSCADAPASGGTVYPTWNGTCKQKYRYQYTSGSYTDWYEESIAPSVSFSPSSYSPSSLGKTEKARTKIGTTTATFTGNGGNSATKQLDVYQEANVKTTTWNELLSSPTGSCADISAGGGTVTATTSSPQTLNQKYTESFTSRESQTGSTGVSCTVVFVGGVNTATASSLGTTEKSRTKITDLTIRATGNSNQTADTNIPVYQEANAKGTTKYYGTVVLTGTTLGCADVPAAGGSVIPTWTGTAKQNYRYKYTSGSYSDWALENITPTVSYNPTAITGSDLSTTEKARTKLGTVTATFIGYDNQSATKQIDVYQESNYVTGSTTSWDAPAITIAPNGATVNSGATSSSFTASATQSGTRTDKYRSGHNASVSVSNSSFSWAWSSSESWATATGTTTACTVTFNANTGAERSSRITASATGQSVSNSTYVTLTQRKAEDKPAPSVNSINISFESYEPTPPTPTCVFSIQNDCNFNFYCGGIKAGSVWLSPLNGDWDANTETMENPTNVSIPFTITEVNGAISSTSIPPSSLTLSAESGSGQIVMERDPSSGAYRYSNGSITITNNDFEIVLN